jgi:integrase
MDASVTITAAQFAGLARDHLQSVLEAARARRAPDPVLASGGNVEASLDPTLTNRILDFVLAAEGAPSDDHPVAAHPSHGGHDGAPIYLPENLAAPLMAAAGSALPPERPMRRSALAAAMHRSQAALGRAMMDGRALIMKDGAMAREMVASAAAAAGVEITPEVRPLLERVGLRVLEGVFREEAAREYRHQDITPFLDTLRRLPSHYGKSPKDKELSIKELIARAETSDAPRLTDKTVKRHLSALSVFFKPAVDRGHLSLTDRNDIIGEHDFSLDDAREARDQWTGEELRQLFSSAVWTGRDPSRTSAPGTEITRDAQFWIPLLCVFEGTRLEEVADLRRKDVRNESGVWRMEITTEHRRSKNNSAKRAVPIHPEFIKLGFLQYVARVAPHPNDRSSPILIRKEPTRSEARGSPGDSSSTVAILASFTQASAPTRFATTSTPACARSSAATLTNCA